MEHPALPLPLPAQAGRARTSHAAAVVSSGALPAMLATGLALALILLDFATWIELNVAVVYSLPLVFAAASRRPHILWSLAACLIGATFVVYAVQSPQARMPAAAAPALLQAADAHLLDRSLAALTVLLTAAILQGWLISLRALERRDRQIEENNARLHQANEALRLHKEEIVRQNAELERRRREVEAVSRRKTQLLASISHDIRTPIHAISLMAEILRRTARAPTGEARLPAIARRLQSQALAAAELLSEVIDLAAFDAGQVALHTSRFDVNEMLAEQAQRMAPLAEEKGLVLELDTDAVPLLACTDRLKLGRIVGNLVGNAVKFTEHGVVSLRSRRDDEGRLHVSVADTGCGIAAGSLDSIFGEFCQEDAAATRTGSGWGLGLAICRRLTLLLEGELRVESAPGKGSTFTVVLPASVCAAAPAAGGTPPP